MQYRKPVADAIIESQEILATATREKRALTRSEAVKVAEAAEAVKAADAENAQRKTLTDLGTDGGAATNARSDTWGAKTAAKMREGVETKALLSPGTTVTAMPAPAVHERGEPVQSLLQVLPSEVVQPNFGYLRETTRTNNADVVAPGVQKPVSVHELVPITDSLKVIATQSSPVDSYMLSDAANLGQFLEGSLRRDVLKTAEANVLGTSTDFTNGILDVAGTTAQAFVTSKTRSLRTALTLAEGMSDSTSLVYVVSGVTWQEIEEGANEQVTGNPIDPARRSFYGVPVVVSSLLADDVGLLLDTSKLAVVSDGQTLVKVDPYTRQAWNEVVLLVETRMEVKIFQPESIIKVDLTV